MAGRQVDDAQPAHAQGASVFDVVAFIVRPPMANLIAHGFDHGKLRGSAALNGTGNSAHLFFNVTSVPLGIGFGGGALMLSCSMSAHVKTMVPADRSPFGKQHAGRTVTVEEIEDGVWLVRTARIIPDNELWIHEPAVKKKLDRAIAWAQQNPPAASDLNQLEKRLKRRR